LQEQISAASEKSGVRILCAKCALEN
jgi:hypothetical protein